MRCPHCRADVPDKFSFCPQCGAAVRTESGRIIRPDGARKVVNTVLIGVLAVNVIGGVFLIRGIQKKNQPAPETTVEELQPEESKSEQTTEAPKGAEPETTKATTEKTKSETKPTTEKASEKTTAKATTVKDTTTKATTTKATTTKATTVKETKATTAKTTKAAETKTTKAVKTTKAASKAAKTTKTTAKSDTSKTSVKQQEPVQQQVVEEQPLSTASADYYASLGGMPFVCGNNGDPFLPPGLYTKATNDDGTALSADAAKQAMLDLPIYWGNDADIFCGTEPDDNGTSNSTYRYITDAFPVPGFSDLQMPAAIDLYIHNGTAAHGSHLRAIDYRFGNHPDYSGQYIWTREEIESHFNSLTAYADTLYGGHDVISDSTLSHYRYQNGALDIGYYERNERYILWISRSND